MDVQTEPAEYIVRKPKEEGKIIIPPFLANAAKKSGNNGGRESVVKGVL